MPYPLSMLMMFTISSALGGPSTMVHWSCAGGLSLQETFLVDSIGQPTQTHLQGSQRCSPLPAIYVFLLGLQGEG